MYRAKIDRRTALRFASTAGLVAGAGLGFPARRARAATELSLWTGYPELVPFYKAVAVSVPTSLVALLRPADGQGHGPYGLEVWRLEYRR